MRTTSTQTFDNSNINPSQDAPAPQVQQNGRTGCFQGRTVCPISLTKALITFITGAIAEAAAETALEELFPIRETESGAIHFGKRIIYLLTIASVTGLGGFLGYHVTDQLGQLLSNQRNQITPDAGGTDNPALSVTDEEVTREDA